MTEIANQYNGTKRKYFLEQLNDCTIDRFESLSTERGKVTITGVREAETMLQSEFEGYNEPKSITRPTDQQSKEYNNFDGRLRKGELSGEPNTLSKKYKDLDSKLFVSDNTLQYQADQKKLLGQKNPHKIGMEEQGKNLGFSGVKQKHKRCDQNKPELPSSSKNVRHIINLLELGQSEKSIAKDNLIESSRIGWAAQLNVAETSISDETALQGIIFLNEDYTIEDIK
jgi:hypothetical protein